MTFRLITVKTQKLHPMTISDKFVTIVAFHHAEVERIITVGKKKGQSHNVKERVPVVIIWDGNSISYHKAEAGNRFKIDEQEYEIDRQVDDIYKFLPSETFVTRLVEPDFKDVIKKFEAKDFFDEVLKFYQYYFYMEDKPLHKIVSLFSINQCVFDAYDSTPYLLITSPLESCGKSNLGKSIQQMWNGILSTNIESHHIFRLVHGCHPTFIIDENQDLDQRKKTDDKVKNLFSVLNSGYQRGVGVIRFKEKSGRFGNMAAETFDTYGPKVIIVTKGNLPRDTESRCLPIGMQRVPKGSPKFSSRWEVANPKTGRPLRVETFEKIREMAVIFRLKYGSEIKKIAGMSNWRDELDHTGAFRHLENRELELFKPLLVLCLKYMPQWTDEVKAYIENFLEVRGKMTYSPETTVLYALRKLWQLVNNEHQNGQSFWLDDGIQISFDETKEDGQFMWVSASIIRNIIETRGIGSIEEFGSKYVESKIGHILKKFEFYGKRRVGKGNYRMITTSLLSKRLTTYTGATLMGEEELTQQDRIDLLAQILMAEKEIEYDSILDMVNGKITEDDLKTALKHMRTDGTIITSSSDGKGEITWCG